MRSFKSKKRWLTLFTLTRTAQPSCSARACAYPVMEKHSIFFLGTVVVWLIGNPMFRSTFRARLAPAPASPRPQTANRVAGRRFRHFLSAPRACLFPGLRLLPRHVGYRPGASRPRDL